MPMGKKNLKTLTVSLRNFRRKFQFSRASIDFDGLKIQQWWLEKGRVYGFKKPPYNDAIARLYWAYCKHDDAQTLRDSQENFLLAHIVPHIKRKNASKIVIHACLPPSNLRQHKVIADLEAALAIEYPNTKTPEQFYLEVRNLLGPPPLTPEEEQCYQNLKSQIFDSSCEKLLKNESAAIKSAILKWNALIKKFRHGGNGTENRVMDVLSYEAIVALHQCYSVAWSFFLQLIGREEKLSDSSAYFLAFWHTDRRLPSQDERADFHLFHGHVFALHGGTGFFLKTRTGRRLIAEYLRNPTSENSLPRLLHGLWVCLHFYRSLLEVHADSRKVQPQAFGELTIFEEEKQERLEGKLPRKKFWGKQRKRPHGLSRENPTNDVSGLDEDDD